MPAFFHATDALLIHREPSSAAVTADASYGKVGATSVDELTSNARMKASTLVYIEAIKISANNEVYDFRIEVSNASNFSALEVAARCTLGATEVRPGGAPDTVAGDYYQMDWSNEVNETTHRYWRLTVDMGGTSPSVTFHARTAPRAL